MANGIGRFLQLNGLAGCYMPDSRYAVEFTTRRDFIRYVRAEIEQNNWPLCVIKQVKWIPLWQHIKKHGSSSVNVTFTHKGYNLEFHGMTDAEWDEESKNQEV